MFICTVSTQLKCYLEWPSIKEDEMQFFMINRMLCVVLFSHVTRNHVGAPRTRMMIEAQEARQCLGQRQSSESANKTQRYFDAPHEESR